MVEVDPIILVAAGTAVVGLVLALACMRPAADAKAQPVAVTSSAAVSAATSSKSKKKKSKSKAKKDDKADASAGDDEFSEPEQPPAKAAAPAPAPASKAAKKASKATPVAVSTPPAPAPVPAPVSAAPVQPPTPSSIQSSSSADEDSKKGKKAKETPEQRAARLERQKVAKAKKLADEELNKNAALEIAANESRLAAPAQPEAFQSHNDGWNVVEDKRKAKKKAEAAAVAAAPAPTPAPAAVAAPEEPAAPVIELVKTTITVEGKKMGAIIGPKGSTLHALQSATGVEISTPKGERDPAAPVIISLTGPPEGINKVTRAINDLVAKGYSKLIAGDDFKEGNITVHPMYLPEIIGKGGCNIRAIQDFTGVKLVIPPVARNETEPVKITVAGPKDKVQQAKDLINEITRVYCTSVTHPGSTHLEMDVPTQMYNYIIGSRGSEIKHIQGNFKVSVHIPNGDSVNKNVVIVGSLAGVQGAQKYIQKIIDQANADRAAAEDVNQAWETAVDEPHEEWMDEYTHPSSRRNQEEGEVLDTAAVAAAAWGAKVLSSAEGW